MRCIGTSSRDSNSRSSGRRAGRRSKFKDGTRGFAPRERAMGTKAVRVCSTSVVEPETHTQVRLPGLGALAVYHVDGEFSVTTDTYTHIYGSLGEKGSLQGPSFHCPWHNG